SAVAGCDGGRRSKTDAAVTVTSAEGRDHALGEEAGATEGGNPAQNADETGEARPPRLAPPPDAPARGAGGGAFFHVRRRGRPGRRRPLEPLRGAVGAGIDEDGAEPGLRDGVVGTPSRLAVAAEDSELLAELPHRPAVVPEIGVPGDEPQ